MAKIKDLASLVEGDKVLVTDHEYQLFDVPGLVRDTLIPSDDGVEFVRLQCEMGDSQKIVTIFQSDVSAGICEVKKL